MWGVNYASKCWWLAAMTLFNYVFFREKVPPDPYKNHAHARTHSTHTPTRDPKVKADLFQIGQEGRHSTQYIQHTLGFVPTALQLLLFAPLCLENLERQESTHPLMGVMTLLCTDTGFR